jgi:hypothetical protein
MAEDAFRFCRWLMPRAMEGKSLLLTRRAIHGTCVTQWFATDKPRRLLGYVPLTSPRTAQARTLAYFATRKDFPQGPFQYAPGQFDYFDDATYKPTDARYLRKREQGAAGESRGRVLLLGAALLAWVAAQ